MTPEEKMKRLSPSHDHFELVDDPWHADAFKGIPEAEEAIADGRVTVIEIGGQTGEKLPRVGKRRKVWYSVDWCGNLIQEWGEDTPPGESVPSKEQG